MKYVRAAPGYEKGLCPRCGSTENIVPSKLANPTLQETDFYVMVVHTNPLSGNLCGGGSKNPSAIIYEYDLDSGNLEGDPELDLSSPV